MCNLIEILNEITKNITGCAIEVHGNSGTGLLESIYKNALCFELNQIKVKAVDRYDPVFEAQMLTYLKVMGKKSGLLMNFNVPILKNRRKKNNSLSLCASVA
jgi:hypothetical protein